MRVVIALATVVAMGVLQASAENLSEGNYELIDQQGAFVKWSAAKTDHARVITYAILDRQQRFPSARNCGEMGALEHALAPSNISLESGRSELAQAFQMWSAVARLEFREIPYGDGPGEKPNIIIGSQIAPVGYAFTDVHTSPDSTGDYRQLDRSLICLNPERIWKIGFDGNLQSYDLRYTLTHEIGHAIGLDHPSAIGQLMSFRYQEGFRQLQSGDVEGAISLYGARNSTPIPEAKQKSPRALSNRAALLLGDFRKRLGLIGRQ